MQRYEPHKTVLKKWPKKCINKSNFLQITTKTEINFYWYFFQNCTFFSYFRAKIWWICIEFSFCYWHHLCGLIFLVLYAVSFQTLRQRRRPCCIIFGSRHSTKKPQEKNWKVKSYCCFCSLERDRTPQKCQQIHSCSKTTEEKRKKVHKSDACWPPNVAKLCRACVSSLIFNSGHISDVT